MSKIGFLLATTQRDWAPYITAFKRKLQTHAPVKIHPPNGADGDANAILQAAKDLANDNTIDVIVTAGTGAALACKQATQANRKPFIFASIGDAQISGLLPQSSGNFGGCCNGQANLPFVHLRVDYMLSKPMFQEPFAVVGNHNNEPAKTAMDRALAYLTTTKGKQAQIASLKPGDNIDTFINGLKNQSNPVKSLYVCSDLFITAKAIELNNKARAAGMKTMWEFDEHKAIHGGDDAHGVNFTALFEKAAEYVDLLLTDSTIKAGDLPLYQPSPTLVAKRKKQGKKKGTKAKSTKRKSQRKR